MFFLWHINQILPVLVSTFWEEDKADKAVEVVRDMERRGVVGTASVYYELACCLCNKGRWRDAMLEVCCYLLAGLLLLPPTPKKKKNLSILYSWPLMFVYAFYDLYIFIWVLSMLWLSSLRFLSFLIGRP